MPSRRLTLFAARSGSTRPIRPHRWVFDTRDDRDRSSALRAGLDVHLKHMLKA